MIDIEKNFQRYVDLVNTITRTGFKKEEFVDMLTNSDFKVAPATMKFHNSVEGGLCDHLLNVYDNLVSLADMKHIEFADPDTPIVTALFHDLGNINQFVSEPRNVKKYCLSQEEFDNHPGAYNRQDEAGTFGWFTEFGYGISPNRVVYGSHESTCEFITRLYCPLRMEESIAILHHTGSLAYDSYHDNIYTIFEKYPLALLLFEADLLAANLDERHE